MTLEGYVLPFDAIVAESPVVVRLGDTLPVVTAQLVKGDAPVDGAEWSGELEVYNSAGVMEVTISGEYDAGAETYYFPWPAPFTSHTEYRSEFKVFSPTATVHYVGPHVYAYDPALLWADPAAVIALTGGVASYAEAVQAIYIASDIVRAWATYPVPSPVPDEVRGVVAVLAARVLTRGPVTGAGGQVKSEKIGDYSVSYTEPSRGSMEMPADLGGTIAWLRPRAYDTDVGPKDGTSHAISSGHASVILVEDEEVVVP